MNIKILILLLFLFLLNISGCISFKKKQIKYSMTERTIDELCYILTSRQKRALKKCKTNNEVQSYLENFWRSCDPSPETEENELKTEYYKRLNYIRIQYPDHRAWGKSDRGRIYILYGPPEQIIEYPWTIIEFSKGNYIKSLEIWVYDNPSGNNRVPEILLELFPHRMMFIFADFTGLGIYTQIYSTEEGEIIDSRFYDFENNLYIK